MDKFSVCSNYINNDRHDVREMNKCTKMRRHNGILHYYGASLKFDIKKSALNALSLHQFSILTGLICESGEQRPDTGNDKLNA